MLAKTDDDIAPPVTMQRSVGHGRIAVKLAAHGATRLAALHQKANAKIRIPRQHAPRLEAVLINTAGGLTGGDCLDWRVDAGPDTHCVIATQACERIYKSTGGTARQTTQITVEQGARLDWLPQETILFDHSALARRLTVDLAADAVFIGLETIVLGRAAMGEMVQHTSLQDRWRIRRDGALVHADDLRFASPLDTQRSATALLGGHDAMATIVCCAPLDAEQLAGKTSQLRAAFAEFPDVRAGVSGFAGKCVIRLLADSSYTLRPAAIAALSVLRQGLPLPAVWRS